MIGASTLVQQYSAQLINTITMIIVRRPLAQVGISYERVHVQDAGKNDGVFGLLSLHGGYVVDKTQQREMKNRWQFTQFNIACSVTMTITLTAEVSMTL